MTRHVPSLVRRTPAALLLSAGLILATASCAEGQGQSAGGTVPPDPETIAQRADDARVKGDTAAPIRILEVSDFQCPYCRQYFQQTFPTIDSLYVERGLVEYVWLAFPNPNHQRAWPAIEAAFCAGAADRFWAMHDTLFANQGEWSNADDLVSTFVDYAASMGIDESSFRSCLVQDKAASLIARDYGQISEQRVRGTPFFVIADSLSFQGAQPVSRFREVLDGILEARGVEPPQ
ncbi:MAG: DsbA family protein [Gemmatimonadota bacterium]